MKVFKKENKAAAGDWVYLRELSDDSVPSNRGKDAHG